MYATDPFSFDSRQVDDNQYRSKHFVDHPLVQQYGIEDVSPVGLYRDKVKVTRTENFVRCSMSIGWHRNRSTLWVVLAGCLCRCGCNGRCTTNALKRVTYWSCNCLQRKMYPPAKHDRTPFHTNEPERAEKAGEALSKRGAICEHRGDMPERHALAGIKGPNVACMCCTCGKEQFHADYQSCSLAGLPWEARTTEVHVSQIEEALYPVFIKDKGTRDELCACLKYKKIHPHGRRACGRGLAKFQLKVGDRLQAVGQIKTIRDLDSVEPPVTVYFLRPSTGSAIANVPIIINIPDVNDDGI